MNRIKKLFTELMKEVFEFFFGAIKYRIDNFMRRRKRGVVVRKPRGVRGVVLGKRGLRKPW